MPAPYVFLSRIKLCTKKNSRSIRTVDINYCTQLK